MVRPKDDPELLKARKEARYRAVLEVMGNEPATAKEIALLLNKSYYTVKPTLNEMVKDGLLHLGGFRGPAGVDYYAKASPSNLPLFRHFGNGQWQTPYHIMYAALDSEDPILNATRAAQSVPLLMTQLMILAIRANEGITTKTDIAQVRAQFMGAYKQLNAATQLLKQAIDNNTLWDEKSLSEVANSPELQGEEKIKNISAAADELSRRIQGLAVLPTA
jgi:hypothetical protein